MAYLDKINTLYKAGNATEHSYRPALKEYLEKLLPGITATNEPKRQKCGAPDYIITRNTRGNAIPIGFIEAKNIGIDLNKTEKDEQLERYKESLDNLILTDYLDFRFFKESQKVAEIKIAGIEHGKIIPFPANIKSLEMLLKDFASFEGQTITSAKNLAVMMARKAKLMQEVFCRAVLQADEHTALKDQLTAFRQILIHDMDAAEFADVYAQTITYGLFTARLHDNTPGNFSRMEALNLIPMSNPFLRKLFLYVAGDLEDSISWIVDALCELLRATNIHDIMADFGKQSGRNDPIVHFYETFLAEYNPKLRKSRGVFYTPEPVVNFIVRAVDDCLKTSFNLPAGLADTSKAKIKVEAQVFDKRTKSGKALVEKEVHKVQLLDVASGTGTFIAEVIKQIYNGHFQHQQGMWSNYVEEHLLPRLHGFEILMASYAMCHMKIELLLDETGYKPKDAKKPPRLGVYLTNSLEEAHPDAHTLFASWLSAEANEASTIKKETPVMVAFGNPPYNRHSSNKGKWMDVLLKDYKQEPGGGKLKEKNSKWLNDDYVKFIRLGENYINKNGEGILAYITNHGYLDNPTFRGMRWHLLNTFDDIYIIDLHGNSNLKEKSPDGSLDENVFDIQQGVCISIFVKTGKKKNTLGRIKFIDLYGTRKNKYNFLEDAGLKDTKFSEIKPVNPYFYFKDKNMANIGAYEGGFSLDELFKNYSTGYYTGCDDLVIAFDKQELRMKINVHDAEYVMDDNLIKTTTFRPFDNRYIYYKNSMLKRSRLNFADKTTFPGNIFLLSGKSTKNKFMNHFFISKNFSELKCAESTKGSYMFPLRMETIDENRSFLNDDDGKKCNFNKTIIDKLTQTVGDISDPVHLMDYIYGHLDKLPIFS